MAVEKLEEEILRALRRITRAIDLHSRYLSNTFGLTGPQLVCLRVINSHGEITPSQLAERVALSQATVTGIFDRLANRQLIKRERCKEDRRVVTVTMTNAGKQLVEDAPSPLQESFVQRLVELPQDKQYEIRDMLNQVAAMMGGDDIKAAPVLTTSPAALSAEEITEVIDTPPADVAPLDGSAGETPAIEEPSSTR